MAIEERHIIEELANICNNCPVHPGSTISDATASACANEGLIWRNSDGNWMPTRLGWFEQNVRLQAEIAELKQEITHHDDLFSRQFDKMGAVAALMHSHGALEADALPDLANALGWLVGKIADMEKAREGLVVEFGKGLVEISGLKTYTDMLEKVGDLMARRIDGLAEGLSKGNEFSKVLVDRVRTYPAEWKGVRTVRLSIEPEKKED